MTIIELMESDNLLGRWFAGPSWNTWKIFLRALFGLDLLGRELEIFQKFAGRATAPESQAREGWVIVGRRGGKSRIAALVAVYLACFRDYSECLAPGEVATIAVIAADRLQARVIMRYVNGFLDCCSMLGALAIGRHAESIEFSTRVVVEIHTATFRGTRGYSFGAVIADECAFWRDETSANPDEEIFNAVKPGLATIPGAMLLCISSPYSRRGALWNAYQRHFGKDDASALVWKSDTLSMNPLVDPAIIAQAYANDESAARAEYGAEFRSDIEDFVTREDLDNVVMPGRIRIEPLGYTRYRAFCDPSGGRSDSFTLAISHDAGRPIPFKWRDSHFGQFTDGDPVAIAEEIKRRAALGANKIILNLLREWKAPFNTETVVEECSKILQEYDCSRVIGDKYAASWVSDAFLKNGIYYEPSERSKSEIYLDFLPLISSRRVELLDNPRLINQLLQLERRTARSGKDSIDHGPAGHDDVANAAAGACTISAQTLATIEVRKLRGL